MRSSGTDSCSVAGFPVLPGFPAQPAAIRMTASSAMPEYIVFFMSFIVFASVSGCVPGGIQEDSSRWFPDILPVPGVKFTDFSDYGDIPAYSTLIFDIRLERVIHPEGPDDRSRNALENEE